MSQLVRLSISLERALLARFTRLARRGRYKNRSAFVRDLIRQRLVEAEWLGRGGPVLGTITLVYDHHAHRLSEKLVHLQHESKATVLAATHVHLSHRVCGEMIMVRGAPAVIQALADQLRQQRGVLHASLTMSSTGDGLP